MEVSPTLISNVTEAVIDEVRQWQTRPLEPVYPIVYVDCLVINVRENQRVINKALYLIMKGPTYWVPQEVGEEWTVAKIILRVYSLPLH